MTNPAAPSFMDAMSAGLDALDSGEIPDAPITPVVTDDAGDAGAGGQGDGDEGAGTDGAGDAGADGGQGGADGSGDAAADGASGADDTPEAISARATAAAERERNPNGTFKTAEQKAAEAKKPDVATAAKPPVKAADPINDPIPAGLKGPTAERMTKLVETAKTLTAERNEAQQDLDVLIDSVKATGLSGEDFGQLLSYVGDGRSDDPVRQERAYEFFTKVVADLSTHLGKAIPGTDVLAGHDDLIARVTNGTLYRKDAEELAAARRAAAAGQSRQINAQHRQQEQNAQQTAHQAAVTKGRADMIELETTLKAADTQFAAKAALIRADAGFMAQLKQTPPAQWTQVFNKKYRETKIAAPAVVPGAARRGNPGQQPIRGKAPAGGTQVTGAKSIEQALGAIDFSKI